MVVATGNNIWLQAYPNFSRRLRLDTIYTKQESLTN